MSKHKKKTAKIFDGAQDRLQAVESLLEQVDARLRQVEAQIGEEAARARQWESQISLSLMPSRAEETGAGEVVALEEGSAVDLDAWERRIEEKYAALCAKEEELGELEKNIRSEMERLRGEIKQRDNVLITREAELKGSRLGAVSRQDDFDAVFPKRVGGRKAGRLVSFLVDIGKKH